MEPSTQPNDRRSSRQKGSRPIDRLAELLVSSEDDVIRSDVVEDLTGIAHGSLRQAVQSRTVEPYMTAYGWSLVKAKDVGRRGKHYFLTRDREKSLRPWGLCHGVAHGSFRGDSEGVGVVESVSEAPAPTGASEAPAVSKRDDAFIAAWNAVAAEAASQGNLSREGTTSSTSLPTQDITLSPDQSSAKDRVIKWLTSDSPKKAWGVILGAWTKNFLHNVHMRDMETFSSFMWQMVLAVPPFTAQVYARSLGRDDQEEYLERHLSTESLAKAAFQRSGFASLFPMAIDTASPFLGLDPIFEYRNTAQPTDILFGNPTAGLLNDAVAGLGGVLGAAREGREPTQGEVRDLYRLLPFQNFIPMQSLMNVMIQDLPERSG